ncbi:MAG TPA: M20/M25/M40 family metallo-hydrolase [Roseiflexaceae bacterium]|nr:M20/M25/M40 family metallo-hydrolase [Roseiflexaceae bacterium]
MNDIYAWIDARRDELVAELQTLLQQPSISAQNIGLEACADLLRRQMLADGVSNTRIEPLENAPAIVYATEQSPDADAKTLLCYGHYDVQPPEPLDAWIDPPFSAAIRDGVIYARGATDNKSGVLAFVRAAQAFREVRGGTPVNLTFLFEGEEEMGSPHLEQWVLNHQDLCQCDASVGLDGGVNRTSYKPEIHLGIKAILVLELRVKSHGIDFWSGRAQLMKARSAPWRLVHCLGSMFDEQGRITIDGWYDDLQLPDADDMRHLREELAFFDRAELARQFGMTADFPFDDDLELLKAIHYGASCNINGLHAGYTGAGTKTIVPTDAFARLDFRCPPNLEPADQLKKLETHLHAHGFDDIEIVVHTARANPYKTPVREAASQAIIHAAERIWGEPPLVMGVSTQGTIMIHVPHPAVMSGFGAAENNLHAPNENMPIERYIQGIKYAATIFQEFADRTK